MRSDFSLKRESLAPHPVGRNKRQKHKDTYNKEKKKHTGMLIRGHHVTLRYA